jgi:hypothetical protein
LVKAWFILKGIFTECGEIVLENQAGAAIDPISAPRRQGQRAVSVNAPEG